MYKHHYKLILVYGLFCYCVGLLTAYTIYLIHLDVFIYFSKLSTSIISSIIFLLISLIVTFFISVFIYKYYEKPIMDLRDKFKLCYFKQEQEKI